MTTDKLTVRTAGADARGRLVPVVALIFLLSGATSLAYQVAWTRMLSLFFGSDVYAAAITLGVFMVGLSLGGWGAGRWGDRIGRPLLVYGLCEVAIAVFAAFFPHLLSGFEEAYRAVYRTHFETFPGLYHGFRLAVATTLLLVPTLLMGATLPLIVRGFANLSEVFGARVGLFYSVNTLGALFGTLAAGFVLLPLLGATRTVTTALVINVVIGLAAIALSARLGSEKDAPAAEAEAVAPAADRPRRAVLIAIALSGMAALALEVVWMRVLVQSFSATVYAFSIMLACFLFGIFYGSRRAGRVVDSHADPTGYLVALELWLGASVASLAVLSHVAPSAFGTLVWALTGITGGAFGAVSILAQFFVASVLIVVPTVLLGETFPFAVKIYTRDIAERARGTGAVYAANTAGAVVGALAGGFVLLPLVGARAGLLVIAGVFVAAGALLAAADARHGMRRLGARRGASALVLALGAGLGALLLPPQTVINYNLQRSTTPQVLFHGEGVANTIDVVKNEVGATILMVNGNIEADTTLTQRRHFILKAHLPLLLHPEPRDVAVVGLGLGITLAATARHPTVRNIRVVELSPEVIEAHGVLRDLTGGVLDNPLVLLRIDDGRNFMSMSDERFDMITADPIHPRITGVGYLYTREYYERIKERLRAGGVVSQWMPMYRISRRSFDVAFRTFASVFPNASFWYVRGHGLFVATLDDFAIDFETVAARFAAPEVAADLGAIGMDSPERFLGHMLMDPEHVAAYLARGAEQGLNTDDNAYLEYRTPFEFIERTENIVDALLPYAGWDVDAVLESAPAAARTRVRENLAERLARMRPELAEPLE